LNTIKKS